LEGVKEMPAGRELTPKQEKYAQGLFKGLTQREAYKEAYNCQNMTDKSIDELACRAANDIKVMSRVVELTNEFSERNMVTKERVLAALAKIAFADIKEFVEFGPEEALMLDNGSGELVKTIRAAVQVKPSKDVDGTVLAEVSQTRDGIKVKPHDKMKALELIGRHLAMFTDKVDQTLTGELAIKHQASKLTDEELEGKIAELQEGRHQGE